MKIGVSLVTGIVTYRVMKLMITHFIEIAICQAMKIEESPYIRIVTCQAVKLLIAHIIKIAI